MGAAWCSHSWESRALRPPLGHIYVAIYIWAIFIQAVYIWEWLARAGNGTGAPSSACSPIPPSAPPGISATCPSPALLRAPRSPRAAGILPGPLLCHSLVLSLSCHNSCGPGQLSPPTHGAGEQFGAGMW